MNIQMKLFAAIVSVALAACGGGGGSPGTTPGGSVTNGTTTTTATVASDPSTSVALIALNASANTLKADGTSQVTVSIVALTAGNASVSGATINLSASSGVILSAPLVVTTATGATVTMTASASDQTNRVSVVTASCSGCSATSATAQVSVVGAALSLNNFGTTSLVTGGSAVSLAAIVKNVAGVGIPGVNVSFASTDASILGLNVPVAVTNSSGVATVSVTGASVGSASINVTALGTAVAQPYTSALASGTLAVTSPANNSVLVTGVGQVINVAAPAATSVTLTSTQGLFGNGQSSQTVPVAGGVASATLTASQGGTIAVTVNDNLSRFANLTLTASAPVSAVNKILLNPSATTLPISTPASPSAITLVARAIFNNLGTDQAVANVPIQFAMAGGPGAGEFLSPALAFTNSAGEATATFTAGAAASIPNGITVTARVQGTAVQTGTAPSNNNVSLTIGGQALSVAFGAASVIRESADKTLYFQDYSIQVTDANNNPVANKLVTLRMQPVAFSTGSSCMPSATYCSEDANGNGSRDAGEDGVRKPITDATAGTCSTAPAGPAGTFDSILTPQNSDGGSVPSSVTTDANGLAAFSMTYLKASAIWIVNKLTASVSANGTETSRSTIFRLRAVIPDVTPDCLLPPSPYSF